MSKRAAVPEMKVSFDIRMYQERKQQSSHNTFFFFLFSPCFPSFSHPLFHLSCSSLSVVFIAHVPVFEFVSLVVFLSLGLYLARR